MDVSGCFYKVENHALEFNFLTWDTQIQVSLDDAWPKLGETKVLDRGEFGKWATAPIIYIISVQTQSTTAAEQQT